MAVLDQCFCNKICFFCRSFDMLNSRNPVTMGERPPIIHPFAAEQLEAMTIISQRVFGLETFTGDHIINEGRWMSVVLLPAILKSICFVASDILSEEEKKLVYWIDSFGPLLSLSLSLSLFCLCTFFCLGLVGYTRRIFPGGL